MLSDRDLSEENLQLLIGRWQVLKTQESKTDAVRLGMDPHFVEQLASLDESQIRRACDCSAALFSLDPPDDMMLKILTTDSQALLTPFDRIDRLVEHENYVLLLNRWASVKSSLVHAQCTFGLNLNVASVLQAATLNDIKCASQRGVRLVGIAARPRYFFHAGRNIRLQRSMRTVLAISASAKSNF